MPCFDFVLHPGVTFLQRNVTRCGRVLTKRQNPAASVGEGNKIQKESARGGIPKVPHRRVMIKGLAEEEFQ